MLDPENIERLRTLMDARMKEEVGLLDELRGEMEEFKRGIRRIKSFPVNTVSIVGTDGGNNNLAFDPFVIHVIRIVDSNGVEYYMDVLTPSTPIEELENKIADRGNSLRRMMDFLGVSSLRELSPMIGGRKPGSATWIQTYRELVEWATLFSLVRDHDYGSDTLIVFDGLLRSKVFSKDLFKKLRDGIEQAILEKERKNHSHIYIVGVAKHSKVIDRYNLVMCTDNVMKTNYPCYGRVPHEMEEKSYVWSEYARDDTAVEGVTEANKFVAGKMFLVKFGNSPHDPIWPVDIFLPQEKDSDRILGFLLNDAIEGFPIPFYPMCLQKAHENSALVDFDMDIIQGQMIDSIRKSMAGSEERFDAFLMTDRDIAERRYGKGLK
jgi:hypothetical protein